MDTSEKYILMCEKAEEVQKQEFSHRPNWHFAYYLHGRWQIEHDFLGGERPPIWLPRQDQLQAMSKHKDIGLLLAEFFWWATRSPTGHTTDVQETHRCNSMEQLWLAFVMYEKYQKVWDGEKWIKNE